MGKTDLELIFTMLGEEGTRQEATLQDAQGFEQNRKAAREGGEAAGMAREAFEIRSGQKVLSADNRSANQGSKGSGTAGAQEERQG